MINFYSVGCVDYYQGLIPLKHFIKHCIDGEAYYTCYTLEELKKFLHQVFFEAYCYKSYWEGDIREEEIYIGGLPYSGDECEPQTELFVMWKQDNNGSTFLASYRNLHYLSNDEVRTRDITYELTRKAIANADNLILELFKE